MDTFVMIYDSNKNLLASSGMMGSNQPAFPKGVLDYTAKNDEDRVTWRPERGFRFATVAMKFDKGYIVAGRSLQETEKLIDTITKLVLLAWLACFVFSTIAFAIIYLFIKRMYKQTKAG